MIELRFERRRLLLLVLLTVLSLGVCFSPISGAMGEVFIGYFGYFGICLIVVAWGVAVARVFPGRARLWSLMIQNKGVVALIGLFSVLVVSYEPIFYKVVMDEPVITGTSLMMHRDRLALTPMRSTIRDAYFELLDGTMDKRPLLVPFLQSVVHDFTGYRPFNGIYLNMALTPFLFLLAFLVGKEFSGKKIGGVISMLLLLSMPLVPSLAICGGLDFLNGILILFSAYLAIRYCRGDEDNRWLSLLLLTLVLLANTRYESALWVLPFGLLILWQWWRNREVRLPWTLLLCPLMMVLPVWQRITERKYDILWQKGIFDQDALFEFSNILKNVEGAFTYFFSVRDESTNSFLLSVVGLAGVLVFCGWLFRTVARGRETWDIPVHRVGLSLALGMTCLFWLLMAFNWGYFDSTLTNRLSFPLQLGMVVVAPWAVIRFPRLFWLLSMVVLMVAAFDRIMSFSDQEFWDRVIRFGPTVGITLLVSLILLLRRESVRLPAFLCVAICAFTFWVSVPKCRNHVWTDGYGPQAIKAMMEFAEAHRERSLFVSKFVLAGTLMEMPSASTRFLVDSGFEALKAPLRARHYRNLYYCQIFSWDRGTASWDASFDIDLLSKMPFSEVKQVTLEGQCVLKFYSLDVDKFLDSEPSE